MSMTLHQALEAARSGERLSAEAALVLHERADLLELGQLAHAARLARNPQAVVTFAVDRNINYTNVCTSGCRFCAFWRQQDKPDAYVLSREEMARKVEETISLGGTHILWQGGHNPELDLDWHCETIRYVTSLGIGIHGYSPPEVVFFADKAGLSIAEVIARLRDAGLGSIPGGGAEILVDRVRAEVAPGKATTDQWLAVMREAHNQDLRTTATMMFGHIETPAERIEHLIRLRELQDETQGFTAFIPWPFQPDNTEIHVRTVGGAGYLRMLALARLVLDNFDHLQASWVTQGPHIGQTALLFGADDLGSTMIEENVVAAAGVSHRLSRDQMVRLIEETGFAARQRNVWYQPVETDREISG